MLNLKNHISFCSYRKLKYNNFISIRNFTFLNSTKTSIIKKSKSDDEITEKSELREVLFPQSDQLPEDAEMPIWDHIDELRERIILAGAAAAFAIICCFCFSKELIVFLEAPVSELGVRFLQLSPGEFFFTSLKVSGYTGILLSTPTIIYQIGSWVRPGLTNKEKEIVSLIFTASSLLFVVVIFFSYQVLTPGALNFFISFADGTVESLWSIDQYFEFVFVLMLGTGLSFQVPVVQIMIGQTGIVNSNQMFSIWKFVVVGSTIIAAFLTPSTDPLTQILLAGPLIGLYLGGAYAVRILENQNNK